MQRRQRSRTEMRNKVSDSVTFACTCCARINESETFVFVYVFTQPDSSNVRGQRPHTSLSAHEQQSLNPAVPGASTSAAANEVKYLYLLFSCITD